MAKKLEKFHSTNSKARSAHGYSAWSEIPSGSSSPLLLDGIPINLEMGFLSTNQQGKCMTEIPKFYTGADILDAVIPDNLIAPDVLAPSELLVFSGVPKIYKSDLMLSWLMHMAVGKPFLGTTPPRPLRIAYFQGDLKRTDCYIRERMERVRLDPALVPMVRENFAVFVQPAKFDEKGLEDAQKSIKGHFGSQPVDIIAIDPLYKFLAFSEDVSFESSLATFLDKGVNKLRGTNPDTGIILVHQSDNVSQEDLECDAFQGLDNKSVLKAHCSTCVIMRRPEHNLNHYQLIFDIGFDEEVVIKNIELVGDQWREIECEVKHETDV